VKLSTVFAVKTSVMLALGTGLTVLITVTGVAIGFAGGWFCFKYARRKNIFNDTDREYFQNLLFRAEIAEEKLAKTELNLAKTGDRADILESSHRVIQDELAEERQNSQMLTAELNRERATRKTIEETIESHQKALEFERQRVDSQLARLAKRMDENHQELSIALRERATSPSEAFAANPF
tara:strand:- start:1725 stop:2267 length:543 start_codon:yes stop_codon:yes gene_type:complete